jgi:hydroxysqualene dehydroxylase
VISAARDVIGMSAEGLTGLAARELGGAYPRAHRAKVVHSVVIKEKRATFSPTPAVERLRPVAETAIAGLLLAGDWTATGLPATIEGAVLSGHTAAGLATGE